MPSRLDIATDLLDNRYAVLAWCMTTLAIPLHTIQPVAEVTSHRRLWSASSSALVVSAARHPLLRVRAFAVAGPHTWNSLPEFVTDCLSHLTFKKCLKPYLFSLSFKA